MSTPITRRAALTAMGTVSLGALLAACTSNPTGAALTSAAVPTSTGATATISPQGAATDLAARFDGAATCTLSPEETEGPYYFDVDAIRRDIREDQPGTPLHLGIRVQDAGACDPVTNAVIDIWHCDGVGVYSGFESASQGGPGGAGPTDEDTFLRGAQVTNQDGIVEFLTVYPGWYRGRTVHIHTKVHVDSATLLTTQLYFDEAVTASVYEQEPYASHTGRDVFNDGDGIFDAATMLSLEPEDDGYLGLITLGVSR